MASILKAGWAFILENLQKAIFQIDIWISLEENYSFFCRNEELCLIMHTSGSSGNYNPVD